MPGVGNAEAQPEKLGAAALQDMFSRGMKLHQQGELLEAERMYREVLRQQPSHFDALHLLGVIAAQTGHTERAIELIGKAIDINASVAATHSNLGKALLDLKRPDGALVSYDRAIALEPDFAEAHYGRGNALSQLRRFAEALASYDEAIALKPDFAMAYNNRGMVLRDLKRPADALESFEKAIALEPESAMAHNNRGLTLNDLYQSEEALASCEKAIALKPDYAEAYNNRGMALLDLRRPEHAVLSYDKAIGLKPDLADAYCNRGNALSNLKRYPEALVSYERAIALKADFAGAYSNRGNALEKLKRYDDAFADYDRAFALNPDLTAVEGDRLHTKMWGCNWSSFDFECAHLISSVENGKINTSPFPFLTIPSSSEGQLKCAKLWVANKNPASDKPIWQGERYNHDRIRLAYLSSDFRQHPVAVLTAGMFETHDRSCFEVTAISIGPDDHSKIRQRLIESFEHFVDAWTFSDDQIASLIRSLEIDILIDLTGFTGGSRMSIFARRPAPIQVSYLGYPGTTGAQYIDYIIADQVLVPEEDRKYYTESVVNLPNSFLVNDSKREISERTPPRLECGLPEAGFVFCSFNQSYKIIPKVFDIWMRLLREIDNSVLWLSNTNETAVQNLKREARNRAVDPERLVFAQRVPLNSDHLARHRLANLFLDTLPYNAHTSASDALWAGLPVLTCLGTTFAGRVAASLLSALDLRELSTNTLEEYEQMAIDLATEPDKLANVKNKLTQNRLTTPLFDTNLFTKHIEAAYTAMYRLHQKGLKPEHIVVPS